MRIGRVSFEDTKCNIFLALICHLVRAQQWVIIKFDLKPTNLTDFLQSLFLNHGAESNDV